MKKTLALLLLLTSFTVMAKSKQEVLDRVERINDAKCMKIKESVGYCVNSACIRYYKYECLAPGEKFGLKLKTKDKKNSDGTWVESVLKVTFSN